MTEKTPAQRQSPCDNPHAVEVRDAQAAADGMEQGGRAASAPGSDADADLKLLRELLAAYGADELRRMIDSLK